MYPSKGTGAYAQQSYSGQQAHVKTHGVGDAGAQRAMASRQSLVPSSQDTDLGGYRAHYEQGTQYSGPYASVYGSTTLNSAHQVGGKGTTTSGIHNDEYVPASSHAYSQKTDPYTQKPDPYSQKADTYSQKSDPYSLVKGSDYDSVDRRHYADQSSYLGIELQNDTARRYADPISIRQRQVDTHDRMDPATLLREQQMLRAAQPLHSGSDPRQSEYLAARAAPVNSYGGRLETVDPRSLPILGSTPYDIQHAPSASHLGGALRRSIDDLYATQGASGVTAPYGVGLPPGRDYISGKGLLSDSEYLAHPMSLLHDRKDDRAAYRRELERDEEHRRELLRAKEKDREREEREREDRELKRERERRDRDREREKERERERERDKERERERERSRRRSLDRRDRERDRSLQRTTKDLPRRLTPRRPSPRRPSPRRASSPPRHEAAHRHRSSFKEKEREYTCKVFPFCLVDAERDYLSLNKRYPRLYVSPECSKVVLHWPKQSLHMSLHTPVSFEHEYVELDGQGGKKALVPSDKISQLKHQNTVWNAKVLLMSGIDSDALNNMCSYKSSEDKIVHFYNVMRFAMIKKDSSFMAIGGSWDAEIDGGDPSVEDTSLIKTAQRYLKDITALDLQFCQHWNRFLEIHYDRTGEDGLFSHKEVTVLYVPDLSESLPSLDTWQTQWLEQRKNLLERERQKMLKDKKSSDEKELDQGKNAKDTKTDSDVKTKNEGKLPDKTKVTPKNSDKGNTGTDSIPKNSTDENTIDEKGKGPLLEEVKVKNVDEKNITVGDNKPKTTVKKKIIKRVIKGKTAAKQETKEAKKESDVIEEVTPELSPKTSADKKVANAPPAFKPEVKTENQEENSTQKESDEAPTAQETVTKVKGKKKIIRRVIKKKVPIKKAAGSEEVKETEVKEEKEVKLEAEETKVKEEKESKVEAKGSEVLDLGKSNSAGKKENDEKDIKKENKISEQNTKSEKADKELEKTDGSSKKEMTKDEKEKKSKPCKQQKDIKEKEKLDEPPAYPGLFLQTKRSKGSKIRSMSLSLGGLLDYNDKDVDESTFELSIFAEAFSEMLQHQMARRLLLFLQKLRKRRVAKKNQRKRERDEKTEKENKRSSSPKQRKLSEGNNNKAQSSKSKKQGTEDQSLDVTMDEAEDDELKNEDKSKNGNKIVEDKSENKSDGNDNNDTEDEDEEPEENIEDEDEEPEENVEDEEMKDVAHDDGTEKADNAANKDNASDVSVKSKSEVENLDKAVNEDAKLKAEKSDKEKPVKSESAIDVVYDKELLQAFRFFDYNRVGYIKVDDLRCLLHNLGMFLSYRDVKELVQCALLESNTAMDNRIFYKKLVKLTDL